MLSQYTYAIWNTAMCLLAVLMVVATWCTAVTVGFFILAVVFFSFALLAYAGKGMYRKHPVKWKPNGELEVDE